MSSLFLFAMEPDVSAVADVLMANATEPSIVLSYSGDLYLERDRNSYPSEEHDSTEEAP